jgi:hypothetical protein
VSGLRPRPLVERFWTKWTGAISTGGYGSILTTARRTHAAHRVAWELAHGPIPDGLFVCHHCDKPSCVNPAHLFLGTPKDNTADMFAKGRANRPRGEAHPQTRLTWEQVGDIRYRLAAGASVRSLARTFAVSERTIVRIGARETWVVAS